MAKKEKFAKNKRKFPFAVLRKGALCAVLGATIFAGGLLAGCDDEKGVVAGPVGVNFHYGAEDPNSTDNPGQVGDFYFETDDGDIWQLKASGWEVISNFKGPQGNPGKTPSISISADGYWVINNIKSDVKAEGEDAVAPTVEINAEGYWVINGTVTDKKAIGEDAETPTIEINSDGYWVINGLPTTVKAKGEDAVAPTVEIIDGKWVINGADSGVKAEAVDGTDGKSAFELAIAEGFDGTVAEWLESLKVKGDQGYYVTSVREVKDDIWGISSHFEFTLNDTASTVVSTESVSRLMPNYYYGATNGDEILELIELGAENIELENDVDLTSALVINHNLSIDLNNHKLTYSNGTQVVIDDGIEVEFKDGEMDFEAKSCTSSSLKVQGGASLILDRVEYVSTGTNVMVIENATSVKVVDSHLTGAVYCVGTNALTEENFGVKIEIDDCEFDTTGYEYLGDEWYDTTPILINIPCTATIKDSKITGHRQAVVVRGGDVVIENCKLINTGKDLYIKGLGMLYNTETAVWGTGNEIPCATLVVGNDGTGIYKNYSTDLTLNNVEIVSQKTSLNIPTIWAEGNDGDGLGTTITYGGVGLNESTMLTTYVGDNVRVNVDANSYEMFASLLFTAMETNGTIVPKLTQDILAYSYDITVEEYIEVMEVRAYAEQLGLLNEFDIWTMFDSQEVYVNSIEGFDYAVEVLDLDYSQIILTNPIYLEQNGPLSLQDCIKYNNINQQLHQYSAKFEFYLNTQNMEIGDAELLKEVVSAFGDRMINIRLTNNITFESLGLVINKGNTVTIDLNGYKISAPNDKVGDGVFHVLTGGRLTIEDYSMGQGVVDGECICEDGYKMAVWADGGEVIINGGTFTNSSTEGTETQYDLIYASNGGRIEINGGTFDCKTPRWTLNIKNEHKDYTFITVNGGEFKNYDPSASATDENKDNNPPTSFVGGNTVETREDGNDKWYVVYLHSEGNEDPEKGE